MTAKINKKPLSFFYKNVLIMFKGTIIAQIIAAVSSVFIAKLYGSEAFGFLGVYIGISSIVSVLNSLQLNNCIIISKEKLISNNWFNFLFLLIPMITFISGIILFPIYFLAFNENFNHIILILGLIASIFLSYNKTHEYLLTKNKKFTPISFGKIIVVVINVFFQLIFYLEFKNYGLIYSSFIAIITITLYFSLKNKKTFNVINLKLIKKSFNENKSIVTFLLPSRFINSLAIQSIPLLIFAFFSPKEAGVYFFSQKILTMPLFLISSSISSVYFEKATNLLQSSKEKLFSFTKRIIINNMIIMLVFIILINTIGIYLLELVLNKSWENLRLYTLILSFLVFSKSSFSPISNIMVVLNKNNISLTFNLYLLFINCIAIYFGFCKNNILYTMYLLSFLGGFGYFGLTFYFLKTIKNSIK